MFLQCLQKYVSILKNLLLPSLEDIFGDSDIKFMDNSSSSHRYLTVKNLLSENNVPQVEWPAWYPDISSIENMWYIFFKWY